MRFSALGLFAVMLASQPAFATVDSLLLSIAPPSATVLAGIDVKRAAASPSGTYMLQQTTADQDFAKLAAASGLNLRRDTRQLLLVGLGQQSSPDSPYAVIARGIFNPARLIAAGTSRGAAIRNYRGVPVLVSRTGSAAAGIAFPRPGVLVMGEIATLHAVLDSGRGSAGINAALHEQVSRIGPASDVWFATVFSGSFLAQQMGDTLPPELRKSGALERVSRSSGGLQFAQNDKVMLDLVARSPADARLISGLLHLAGSLSQLHFGGNAGLLLAESALSSMQVASEGSTVHATSRLSDAQLQRALASGH